MPVGTNQGVTPSGSGHSPEGGATSSTASPAKPSIPNAVMSPGEMRTAAEAFVRRCVVGIPCSESEIIKASAAAFNAFTWHIDAIRHCGINGLFGPNPWETRRIMNGQLVRGWQVFRDGKPISGLFDESRSAIEAMEEFRAEASAIEARRAETLQDGSVHESAGPQDDAQPPQDSNQGSGND